MSETEGSGLATMLPEQPATLRRQVLRRRASGGFAIAIYRIICIALLILIWQSIVELRIVRPLFLAPPTQVASTLKQLEVQGQLWGNVWATVEATLVGFGAAFVVGVGLGFGIGLVPFLNRFLAPFITMANSTPRIALAPLFVLWFGIGIESRIVLVFSYIVFIFLANTISGMQGIERDYVLLVRLQSSRRLDLIVKVGLPSVLPWILAAMRVAFPYAIAGAVVGEMFLGQSGLGYLIATGSGVFNISEIFAAIVAALVIAYFGDLIIGMVERTVLKWRNV